MVNYNLTSTDSQVLMVSFEVCFLCILVTTGDMEVFDAMPATDGVSCGGKHDTHPCPTLGGVKPQGEKPQCAWRENSMFTKALT